MAETRKVIQEYLPYSRKEKAMKVNSRFANIKIGVAVGVISGFTAVACAQAPAPGLAPAVPQTPGFSSKPILASPITGVEGKEVVLIAVTLEPGASSPSHTHPGDCYGSVVEGTIELRVEGKEPRRVAAGEAYSNLAGPVHQFTNVGDKPLRLINMLVVEKGKPRTVTLPMPQR